MKYLCYFINSIHSGLAEVHSVTNYKALNNLIVLSCIEIVLLHVYSSSAYIMLNIKMVALLVMSRLPEKKKLGCLQLIRILKSSSFYKKCRSSSIFDLVGLKISFLCCLELPEL
jgi:hypothetical protein